MKFLFQLNKVVSGDRVTSWEYGHAPLRCSVHEQFAHSPDKISLRSALSELVISAIRVKQTAEAGVWQSVWVFVLLCGKAVAVVAFVDFIACAL